RRRIIAEISRAGGEGFDFGISRAGRFANQERGLKALIAVKEQAAHLAGGSATGQDEAEKQSLLLSVEAHKVQLAELLVEKEKERWRILHDEFELSRKLVTAGPAELLRKIVAERMVQRGIQPGQF